MEPSSTPQDHNHDRDQIPHTSPLWQGTLTIRGLTNELQLTCIAQLQTPCSPHPPKSPPPDPSTWPKNLQCNGASLKSIQDIPSNRLYEAASQWYVRLIPIDNRCVEIPQPRLAALVRVISQRRLVFQISCEQPQNPNTPPGNLYLSALQIPPHESSLFGTFCPYLPEKPREVLPSVAIHAPTPQIYPPTPRESNHRVWHGSIHVRGKQNDIQIPCVAVQYVLSDGSLHPEQSLIDASGWPDQLRCDVRNIRKSEALVDEMNRACWYVRFAPVDAEGREMHHEKLQKLVQVLVERRLVFEVDCRRDGGTPGTLYMWGLQIAPHGDSFLGVFLPRACVTNAE